ncbi:TPA: DNA sulfur modification protein DndE [Vibrio cholerae]|uniref:DNA sulfur modification protein DndE n=1 Tax=Vibrio cholerae TaxID=666 RepID=UPI0011D30873|nr:DNA sulfur modification protein DndE [Vibrio cholerae]EGR0493524.1 DNA sulfur modification protein DndE [Vibrio cholerae]MCU4221006.1 DNA sulfur modification protein DndE [Vibrio cholerae]TXY72868.1 DNA sulfur modification protein DndE [Vibrio cholerae]GIB10500.1 DNA sulfur modification protein DndE [Vibrio cholerae]HAS3608757.1 DNA sulfur modification protein DndE [Vibrio cholerae]
MLPNRMNLTRTTEEQLKKLKGYTGITPNVSARVAFFRSIESDFRYQGQEAKLDGSLVLDKYTWLGETSDITELVLKMYYPELDAKGCQQAWAAHVEDGIASIRNHKQLANLSMEI